MVKQNKKGQAFSTDILVVVIIILFGTLFLVMNAITQAQDRDLQQRIEASEQEARILVEELKTVGILDSGNNVDATRLLELDRDQLRQELDLESDFAIVFERDGNLIKIDADQDVNCIGSNSITVNGIPCQ